MRFLSLLLALAPLTQARGDAASISFVNYDHRGDQAFEARTGLPPVRIKKTFLINSLNVRQKNLSSDNVPPGEDLKLSDYGLGTIVSTPLGHWTMTGRGGVNFSNARSSLKIKRESTFYNGLLVFTRAFGSNPFWKYSLGVVVLGRGSRIPAVPVVAFDYESEGQVYQLQLGFPSATATYGVTNTFRVGLFSNFTSGSYLLPEDSALRADGDYIGVDRIILGTLVRAKLSGLVWLNTRVGYSVYGKTAVLGPDLKERRELDEESGLYVMLGLGVAIPRSLSR